MALTAQAQLLRVWCLALNIYHHCKKQLFCGFGTQTPVVTSQKYSAIFVCSLQHYLNMFVFESFSLQHLKIRIFLEKFFETRESKFKSLTESCFKRKVGSKSKFFFVCCNEPFKYVRSKVYGLRKGSVWFHKTFFPNFQHLE